MTPGPTNPRSHCRRRAVAARAVRCLRGMWRSSVRIVYLRSLMDVEHLRRARPRDVLDPPLPPQVPGVEHVADGRVIDRSHQLDRVCGRVEKREVLPQRVDGLDREAQTARVQVREQRDGLLDDVTTCLGPRERTAGSSGHVDAVRAEFGRDVEVHERLPCCLQRAGSGGRTRLRPGSWRLRARCRAAAASHARGRSPPARRG
jgi:hypothetical protein